MPAQKTPFTDRHEYFALFGGGSVVSSEKCRELEVRLQAATGLLKQAEGFPVADDWKANAREVIANSQNP